MKVQGHGLRNFIGLDWNTTDSDCEVITRVVIGIIDILELNSDIFVIFSRMTSGFEKGIIGQIHLAVISCNVHAWKYNSHVPISLERTIGTEFDITYGIFDA